MNMNKKVFLTMILLHSAVGLNASVMEDSLVENEKLKDLEENNMEYVREYLFTKAQMECFFMRLSAGVLVFGSLACLPKYSSTSPTLC